MQNFCCGIQNFVHANYSDLKVPFVSIIMSIQEPFKSTVADSTKKKETTLDLSFGLSDSIEEENGDISSLFECSYTAKYEETSLASIDVSSESGEECLVRNGTYSGLITCA